MSNVEFRIQHRRATKARWSEVNEVLYIGERGYEIGTGREKVGDGVTPWNSLPYLDEDEMAVIVHGTSPTVPRTHTGGVTTWIGSADPLAATEGDLRVRDVATAPVILVSPNGTRYRLLVANDGTLSVAVAP